MTERGERVDAPFGGWIQGEFKAIRNILQPTCGSNGTTLKRISSRKFEEMCKIMLKEAYEELAKMYGEENIISAAHPRRRDNAPPGYCDFVPLTAGE